MEGLDAWLITYPEFAMGYQKAYVTLSNRTIETGIIINAQVFLRDSEIESLVGQDLTTIANAASREPVCVVKIDLIHRTEASLKGVRQVAINREINNVLSNRMANEAQQASGFQRGRLMKESCMHLAMAATAGAKDAVLTFTEAGEVFKRFSAFANDKRITRGRGLTNGTFATTAADAANVHTGSEAVARYALPNNRPATNVFSINPPEDTRLQRGIAQPANGQPGGGEEVIFVFGTPDNTVTGPDQIPP